MKAMTTPPARKRRPQASPWSASDASEQGFRPGRTPRPDAAELADWTGGGGRESHCRPELPPRGGRISLGHTVEEKGVDHHRLHHHPA